MTASFSVVVNTLNRGPLLYNALAAVIQQRHPVFEVVVVYGPSTDNTWAVIAQFPQVKPVRCEQANLSMSRNIGVAAARGEFIAFLDDDAVPEPDWLERLQAGYDAPDVGGVGGFIRDESGLGYQSRVTLCDRFGDSEGFDSVDDMPPPAWLGDRYLSPTGANSSYRRRALLEIGGFDETFDYFLDETDVNIRLWDAGWRIRFAPDAEVHHKYAASAQRDSRRAPLSLYSPCRSKAYFALRHNRTAHRSAVLHRLADHGVQLLEHNRGLVESSLINASQKAKLDADVERGLSDGVALASRPSAPPLLNGKTLARQAGQIFRPVVKPLRRQERLRIVFASQQYPPGMIGGVGVWTECAARALVGRGHEVCVVTATNGRHPSINFEHGVWVHRIVAAAGQGRSLPRLVGLPSSISDYACAVHETVAGIVRRRGVDVVSWPIWDLEGLALQHAQSPPTLLTLHTTYGLAAPFKPDWRRNPAYRRDHVDRVIAAETALLSSAPHILANSRQVLADLADFSGANLDRPGVSLVPHGLNDRSVDVRHKRCNRRVQLLFVGRLEPRKGVDLLLQAVPRLLNRYPEVEVRLVGEDMRLRNGVTVSQDFNRRFKDQPWRHRVRFDGFVSAEVLDQAYADCDIFIAPSRYESFGLVFIEAMMFAKPCIGTRAGGMGEVVAHGETGLLAEPGDITSLIAAAEALINDPELRRRLGEAGRARYLAQFTAEHMATRLEAVFQTIVRSTRDAAPRVPSPDPALVGQF